MNELATQTGEQVWDLYSQSKSQLRKDFAIKIKYGTVTGPDAIDIFSTFKLSHTALADKEIKEFDSLLQSTSIIEEGLPVQQRNQHFYSQYSLQILPSLVPVQME